MPAIAAHRLIGQRLLDDGRAPRCVALYPDAFLVGCQGPDPLFFRFRALPPTIVRSVSAARALHRQRPAAFLDAIAALGRRDGDCALSFALGMACHYAVDRTVHPLVYATQDEVIAQGDNLARASHEVHAIIESDIDVHLLREQAGTSARDADFASMLDLPGPQALTASALVAQAASDALALPLAPTDYARALSDMRLAYRVNEPYGHVRTRVIAGAERIVRTHSLVGALSHRDQAAAGRTWANEDRHAWVDPHTHEPRHESLSDLIATSMTYWQQLADALAAGTPTADLVANVDYRGVKIAQDA